MAVTTWHPLNTLPMKQLALKTSTIFALTSSDRAQIFHALRVDGVHATPQGLEFVVFDVL